MTIQNPYHTLGPQLKTALDYIINNIPLRPSFDNLNNTLFDALFGTNPPSDRLAIVYAKSVLPMVYNSYLTLGIKTSPSVPLLQGEGGRDGNTPTASLQDGSLCATRLQCPSPFLGEGSGVRSINQHLVITELFSTLRTTPTESI